MKARPITVAAALSLIAGSTLAQGLPGLWEVTQKMGGNPEMEKAIADMQKQMAAMPAAERKQMEAMMGSKGMSMPGAAGGGATVVKTCVTKEMVERNQIPMHQGDCTSSVTGKTGNSSKMKFTCTKPPSSGEGEFTFAGDKAYTMKMKINSLDQGKPHSMTIDASGKWLGADCGSIRPLVMPKN
jgi:hypothetical protein